MVWRLGWCPWGDPASEYQERIEGVLAREDRELRERIAMERFAQHERKEDDDRERDGIRGANLPAI
jgi:hypothetical protein